MSIYTPPMSSLWDIWGLGGLGLLAVILCQGLLRHV
jgi:hypothetical protein